MESERERVKEERDGAGERAGVGRNAMISGITRGGRGRQRA